MESSVKTAITRIEAGQIQVRGYDLSELIGRISFGDAVFLLLAGRLPGGAEGRLLEAVLVSSIDHGVNAPSTHVARTTASCGAPLQAAIATGVTAIGESHGGAGEACAHLLQTALQEQPDTPLPDLARELVSASRARGERLPGFGHRVHTVDPRAARLLDLALEWGLSGQHIALAQAIEQELASATGRSLPLNVDGAIAAILSDLGLDWRLGKALFIIARTAGLAAHVHEQITTGQPLKFAAPLVVEYTGPEPQSISP